jgi:hypothetical protein
MIRLLRYVYMKMRDNWRWFRRADREDKARASSFWGPF